MGEKKVRGEFSLSDVPSLIGSRFKIVRNGLNKEEVFEFIAQLIESNNEKGRKLEHIESLRRLGETTVIEAGKLAETIKAEMIDNAREETAEILAEAEKNAKVEAERIINEAQQQAQDMLKNAEVALVNIKNDAEDKANMVITEANRKVEESLISAEKQARSILQNAQKQAHALKESAEMEAQNTRKQAEELRAKSAKIADSIRNRFEETYKSMLASFELNSLDSKDDDEDLSGGANTSSPPGDTSNEGQIQVG